MKRKKAKQPRKYLAGLRQKSHGMKKGVWWEIILIGIVLVLGGCTPLW